MALTVQSTLALTPPVALGGLSQLVARLTSLSKAKTALACVVVAAVPVMEAMRDLQRSESVLASTRIRADALQIEATNLHAQLASLQSGQAWLEDEQRNEETARDTRRAAAAKLELLRERIRTFLASTDPAWPKDLPFVKFPKRLLGELHFPTLGPEAGLSETTRDVFAITPAEATDLETLYRRFTVEAEQLIGLLARSEVSSDGSSLALTPHTGRRRP